MLLIAITLHCTFTGPLIKPQKTQARSSVRTKTEHNLPRQINYHQSSASAIHLHFVQYHLTNSTGKEDATAREMAKEYFWGAKLSDDQKTVTWDPDADMHDDEDDDDDDAIEHFLFLKQAVLGVEAKEGKRNIIEIETTNFDGETVCQPLISLKLGLNESVCLDIGLQPPVTFKLAVGSGPVYLSGQHALDLQDHEDFRECHDEDEDLEDADDSIIDTTPDLRKVLKGKAAAKAKASKKPAEDEDEEDEDEDEEEEEEEVKVAKGKKRPAPSAGGSAKKLAKTEKDGTSIKRTITNGKVENGVEGDEHDDDDEEDEDYKVEDEEEEDASEEEEEDEEMALGAGESDDEEESDEDEDMEGEDDDEDDDEEDEDEEEEEESSPDKSPKKKTKGKVNGVKKAEPAKAQGKSKGQKEKKKAFTIEEMKKSIMQSPGKPKKEEKFKNFVKARFQLTEAKKIQELWGWFKSTQLK